MKHLAPLAFVSMVLAAACSATVDLNNRSCPCATGWQCCSNDLCVPEGASCFGNKGPADAALLTPPNEDSGASDAGPPRNLQSYCDGNAAYRARCYPDAGPRAKCPSDIACAYSTLTQNVVEDALGCSESRACNAGDDRCWSGAFDKVRTQADTAFTTACARRVQACEDKGIAIDDELCVVPLSAFKSEIREELSSCFAQAPCDDFKACLRATLMPRGCDPV